MDKDDLVKLTEALGALGYTIKTFNYTENKNEILTKYWPVYFETEREIELRIALPIIKSDTRP